MYLQSLKKRPAIYWRLKLNKDDFLNKIRKIDDNEFPMEPIRVNPGQVIPFSSISETMKKRKEERAGRLTGNKKPG